MSLTSFCAYPDFSLVINGGRAGVDTLFQHDLYVILTNELQDLPQQKKANLIQCARLKKILRHFQDFVRADMEKNENM